ncbi:transcription termination factor Rho [Lachnospiraceae bacterium CLA-AA-H224]|uniref:Transcription termination factor Rho n=2 Tax=Anthropogastromicrobium aceti TaxID=2981768 RepID=A0AAE3E5W5_9FIRM|nr:transcription termination factor Rho [Anthropogastromicrobium aceti]
MREKLKSLPLTELKQIAKENHIKNVSTLRKAQLIDVILERLSPEQAQTPQTQNVQTSDTASSDNELVSASSEPNSTDTKTALSETDSSQMSSAPSSSDDVQDSSSEKLADPTAQRERRSYAASAASYAAARNNFYSRNNSYSSSSFKDLRQSNAHTVHPRKPRVRNGRPDSNWREDSVNRFDTTRNDSQGRFDNTRIDSTSRFDNTRIDSTSRFDNTRMDSSNRFDSTRNDVQNRFDNTRNDSQGRFDNSGRDFSGRSDFSARNDYSNRYDSRNDYQNRYNNSSRDYTNRYDNYRNDFQNRFDSRNDYQNRTDFNRNDRNDAMNRNDMTNRTDAVNRFDSRTELSSQNRFDSRDTSTQYSNRFDNAMRDDFANRFDNDGALPEGCQPACGILEVLQEGFGFLRSANFLTGQQDVYVAPSQIRRFGLRTGDMVDGFQKANPDDNKYDALIRINTINGVNPELCSHRPNFEKLTPVFPNSRLSMEVEGGSTALRIVDLISPIGKGQRGMIVSPPKAGKTTLLKEIANAVTHNYPDMHLIILLIDERPEEVTDIRESIQGEHVEVIYSTFDETPEHHKQVAEMVLERAKRLVEHKQDVMVLLDSLTRLARAYNLTVTPSGRTLSGGLDPAALHMPKKFFGAARNMREGGSLTILATALVDTGSRLDDMVFEEFKGTGNMELVLDRKLSERRIFPAIDITRSGTRREDLLLTPDELTAVSTIRKSISGLKNDDAIEQILNHFVHTKNNAEFIETLPKVRP